MRVKFKDRNINIYNMNDDKSNFYQVWEGYTIEINKESHTYSGSDGKHKKTEYNANCWNPLGDCIVSNTSNKSISLGLQECFDNIESDVDDITSTISELSGVIRKLRKYDTHIKCPYCESKKIFKFRLDSDWASGSGDYDTVNDNEYYSEEELNYDSFNRPDIEIFHCGSCGRLFD